MTGQEGYTTDYDRKISRQDDIEVEEWDRNDIDRPVPTRGKA